MRLLDAWRGRWVITSKEERDVAKPLLRLIHRHVGAPLTATQLVTYRSGRVKLDALGNGGPSGRHIACQARHLKIANVDADNNTELPVHV